MLRRVGLTSGHREHGSGLLIVEASVILLGVKDRPSRTFSRLSGGLGSNLFMTLSIEVTGYFVFPVRNMT